MNIDNMQTIAGRLKRIRNLCEEIDQIDQTDIEKIESEMRAFWDGETANLLYDKLLKLHSTIGEEIDGINESIDNIFDKYKIENSGQNVF